MARDWETWLKNSIGPASATEEQDRDRTEKRIRDAIATDSRLQGNVRVFVKGSYANNTNIRQDSDVDIAVEWKRWSYIEKVNDASPYTWNQLGVQTCDEGPLPSEYRRWVEEALVAAFGATIVAPGNNAIVVNSGSTTLDADVVPCFRLNRYSQPGLSPSEGNRLYPKSGDAVSNWPDQHKANGTSKNQTTQKRYKQLVRALKRLENDMIATDRLTEALPSYFVECLLYNVKNATFGSGSYKSTAEAILAEIWHAIRNGEHNDWSRSTA
jgi:predicted nucleotidyltransferase